LKGEFSFQIFSAFRVALLLPGKAADRHVLAKMIGETFDLYGGKFTLSAQLVNPNFSI